MFTRREYKLTRLVKYNSSSWLSPCFLQIRSVISWSQNQRITLSSSSHNILHLQVSLLDAKEKRVRFFISKNISIDELMTVLYFRVISNYLNNTHARTNTHDMHSVRPKLGTPKGTCINISWMGNYIYQRKIRPILNLDSFRQADNSPHIFRG